MAIPLQNARLCLDCDTVFEEARCPRCDSQTFFPLSRWVRPALAAETHPSVIGKRARNTSLVLLGSGVAYGVWKLLGNSDKGKKAEERTPKEKPSRDTPDGS